MKNDFYSKYSNSVPNRSELENLLGYFQNKQYDVAIKIASELSEKFPNHPFSWTVLGAIFNQTGKLNEALIACQKAVLLEPNRVESHNNLGNTLFKLDRNEEAEECCRQAIALEPKNELAQNNLGKILFKLKKLDEAEDAFKEAIKLNKSSVQAYFNLGNTLKEQGKLEEAISIFTEASLIDLKNPELYVLQGLTPSLLARKSLTKQNDLMKSINTVDWGRSEILLKRLFLENPSHTVKNVEDFISLWCSLCRDLINQNAIKILIPIFIKLLVIGERNADLDNLIRLFFKNFDIEKALELVEQENQILINLSYCQYNFLEDNLALAEAIAIENIQKAESLIKFHETEDLGWLVVRRSLAACTSQHISRKAFTNLINSLLD